MPNLETAIRLIIIGQELLIALVLLLSSGSRNTRIAGALLLIGIAGYLYNSDPVLRNSVPTMLPVAMLLAIAVPYGLWAFARALFEAAMPRTWITAVFLAIGVATWLIFVGRDFFGQAWVETADLLMHVVALIMVIHSLWLAAAGRPDDLLEARRRFRMIFVILVSIQVTAVLVVELLLGGNTPPGWLTLLNVIFIGGLTMGLAVPLLRLNPVFFASTARPTQSEQEREKKTLGAADRVLHQKLMASMNDALYRKTGLTIRSLAAELGFPEHQLRRVINRHLGYRNFSAFLNSYRIEEAKTRLSQAEFARTPVLTIALDLGYGSLGPFNRAFKASTNMTPTSYREQSIPGNSADSEKI